MELTMLLSINFNMNDFKTSLLSEHMVHPVFGCSNYEFQSSLGLLDVQIQYYRGKNQGFSNQKINASESFQLHCNYTFYQIFNHQELPFIYSINDQSQYLLNRSTFSLTYNSVFQYFNFDQLEGYPFAEITQHHRIYLLITKCLISANGKNLSLVNNAILKWRMMKNIVNYNLKMCYTEQIVLQIELDSYLADSHEVFLFCLESQLSLKNSTRKYLNSIKQSRQLSPIPWMSDAYFTSRKNMPLYFILDGLHYNELIQYISEHILEYLLDIQNGFQLKKLMSHQQFYVLKAKGYFQLMQFVQLLDQGSNNHKESSIEVIPISCQIQFQNSYDCQNAQRQVTADGVQCQGNGRILEFQDIAKTAKYFLFYRELVPNVEVHY